MDHLYPELVEHGGLAPALRAAAAREDVDLGEMSAPAWPGPDHTVYLTSSRGGMGVSAAPDERRFSIALAGRGHSWAYGDTADLSEVVGVLRAWRDGATLRELGARFPFMTYDVMAQAYEDGNPVEVRWELLLSDPELDLVRPLLRVAHGHPGLRALFPSVSHLTLLRLSLDPADLAGGEVRILLSSRGGYRVDVTWEEAGHQIANVDEAVGLAASLLAEWTHDT